MDLKASRTNILTKIKKIKNLNELEENVKKF